MTTAVLSAAVLVAAGQSGGAGSLAFLVVALLAVATLVLYRSMKKHLGKVPKAFDRPEDPATRSSDAP